MARYFFDTVDGGTSRDDEGIELPDAAAARVEGIRLAGELIADQPDMLKIGGAFALQVCDDTRTPLFTLRITVEEDGAPITDA